MEKTNRESIISQLRESGISPLESRIAVLSYLDIHREHPTAEAIYHSLSPLYPTLSLTTVYNTLKLLVQKKLVTCLNIDESEARYDYCTDFHAHFRCRECGEVFDLNSQEISSPILASSSHHVIDTIQVNCYGLCEKCRKNEKKQEKSQI